MSEAPPPIGRIPPWIAKYFEESYDSLDRLMQVIHLSRRSIAGVSAMPRLKRAIAAVSGKVREEAEIERVEKDAELAKSEIANGFPVLHTLAVVALWSWLEHTIKGLLVEHISRNRKSLVRGAFSKLKIKLGDYVVLTKREQASYVVDLLEQEASSISKRGINRFEVLLESLNLTGVTPATTSKHIFELQQIRNAIVHQNGHCDRRLRSNCPWLKLKVGSQIKVNAAQLALYEIAVSDYALEVLYRIGDEHGVDLRSAPVDTT